MRPVPNAPTARILKPRFCPSRTARPHIVRYLTLVFQALSYDLVDRGAPAASAGAARPPSSAFRRSRGPRRAGAPPCPAGAGVRVRSAGRTARSAEAGRGGEGCCRPPPLPGTIRLRLPGLAHWGEIPTTASGSARRRPAAEGRPARPAAGCTQPAAAAEGGAAGQHFFTSCWQMLTSPANPLGPVGRQGWKCRH